MAATGDPELEGLFIGAGRAVDGVADDVDAEAVRDYVAKVSACEAAYVKGRRELAAKHTGEMRRLEAVLLEKLGGY